MSAVRIQDSSAAIPAVGARTQVERTEEPASMLAEVIPFPNIHRTQAPKPRRVARPVAAGPVAVRPTVSVESAAKTIRRASAVSTEQRVVRAIIYLVATILLFTTAVFAGLALRPAPYNGPTWQHSVVQGESVWSLAAAIGSERALEDVVADIYALNSFEDEPLMVGQRIVLPAR